MTKLEVPSIQMKHFQDFAPSGCSFEDNLGKPTAAEAALGRIVLGFSFLEDTTNNILSILGNLSPRTAASIASNMSFRQKLDTVSALILDYFEEHPSLDQEEKEFALEIITYCGKAEDLRNSYLHSSYSDTGSLRAKATARRKSGLKLNLESIDAGLLLDVADYIVDAGMNLEGLPMVLGYADLCLTGCDYVTYSKGGKDLVSFRFGQVYTSPE